MTASEVFHQNDGTVTKAYYERLCALGPMGVIAMNLFRAQKRSSRAKDYRRGKFRRMAYDVKQFSIAELCKALAQHGANLGFGYGWKPDPNTVFGGGASWVFYTDIPGFGQVSFHSPERGSGPNYGGEWDRAVGVCAERIIAFCDSITGDKPHGSNRIAQPLGAIDTGAQSPRW